MKEATTSSSFTDRASLKFYFCLYSTLQAMGSRKHIKKRCSRCLIHHELCQCSDYQGIELTPQMHLLQSGREYERPTSTGALACNFISNSKRYVYGRRDTEFDSSFLDLQDACLLYRHPKAKIIEELSDKSEVTKYKNLIVLDGSWREIRRLFNRLKLVNKWPIYMFNNPPKTRWGVRSEYFENGLATAEAIAYFMQLIGEDKKSEKLMKFFDYHTKNILRMRGITTPPSSHLNSNLP